MKRRIIYGAVLAVIFSAGMASATTLSELMDLAVKQRDTAKAYKQQVYQAEQDLRVARSAFMPNLDVGYQLNVLDERNTFEAQQNHGLKAAVTYNLFSGLRDKYQLTAAKNTKERADFIYQGVAQEIRLNVALSYLEVFRAIARLQVAKDSHNLYKDRHASVKLKNQVGLLKKSDLLSIQVEMDNAAQDVTKARAAVRSAENLLSFYTGMPVTKESLEMSVFDVLPEVSTYPVYADQMMEYNSILKSLNAARGAAVAQKGAQKSAYYPMADVSLSYENAEDHLFPGNGDTTEEDVRLQATVSMNLFDGMAKYSRIKKADMEIDRIDYERSEAEKQLQTFLKNRLLDANVALDNLEVANDSVASAEENLRVTDFAFKKGITTSTELLDAIFFLSRARSNRIEARTQVFSEYFRIRRLIENL